MHIKEPNIFLKRGMWVYLLLLLFEGALRKWFLPGLATPLLIIRDPLAIGLLLSAKIKGQFPKTDYIPVLFIIGLLSTFIALFFGHHNLIVALFGARILLLHFPLMFLIGYIFTREDVIEMGRAMVFISIPVTVLLVFQFYSPQSAWVNRGLGGDLAGSGFDGALGFYRPSGTFSFTLGNSLFYSLVACFIYYFWFQDQVINRFILLLSSIGLILAIPLSMSRSLLFQVILSLIFVLVAALSIRRYWSTIFFIAIIGILSFLLMNKTNFFVTSTNVFATRFENASTDEGGLKGTLINRFLGGSVTAITQSLEQPLWGYGIGMGTNVGAQILSGKRGFLISEGEWGRLIGELGPVLGLIVIIIRINLGFKIAWMSYKRITKGDLLPWLLLSFGLLLILQGGWAQPTSLGFCTIVGGLLIASLNPIKKEVRQPESS